MTIWVDAQLSPHLAPWLSQTFNIDAKSVGSLGYRDSEDSEVFNAARQRGAAIMSKDQDFVGLVARLGSPPQIIWVTCGNTSNDYLRKLLRQVFPEVLEMLRSGEPLVELSHTI